MFFLSLSIRLGESTIHTMICDEDETEMRDERVEAGLLVFQD